ncbi:MAG: helix-turn-helix transcriptional regulator [Vicinamibacterales bacterium]
MTAYVRRCRTLARRLPDLDADRRFDELIGTLHQAPSDCRTRAGRAVIAALVAELADRALREAGHDDPTEAASRARAAVASGRFGVGDATGHPHVDRALVELGRRATDPAICLAAVADSVGVSRWHLSRLLRSWTGRSFFGLLATLRVREAKRLLAETTLSVKEVAAHCGYEHVSHLDRQFRHEAGVTPGVYRSLWQVRPARARPGR